MSAEEAKVVLLVGQAAGAAKTLEHILAGAGARGIAVANPEDVGQVLDGMDTAPVCAIVEGALERATGALIREPRLSSVPLLARTRHPAESEYLRAIRAGADDVVLIHDEGAIVRRLAVVGEPRAATSGAAAERRAIVAQPDALGRALRGRALRRAGLTVSFAGDQDDLKRALAASESVDVVIVEGSMIDAAEGAHGWVRTEAGDHTLPVVVLTDDRGGERGGHRIERTGWLPEDAPTENLVFLVNELFATEARDQRASPRVLFATLCAFRRASDLVADYGVTYNVSREGIFVRTFQPPEAGSTVWLELRPPGDLRAVHLRGTVAWRRVAGGRAAVPPGFAVRILPQLCPAGDLERYRACYAMLSAPLADEPRSPSDAPSQGGAAPSQGEAPPSQGSETRVLVADDDPSIRAICERTLTRMGIQVTLAEDGEQAVRAFRATRFDAVVTDIDMPRLDGLELLRAIRAHDDQIPVLIVTGNPSLDTAIQALDRGALRYIRKPFDPSTLDAAVTEGLSYGRLARFRREAARILSESGVAELGDRETMGEVLTSAIRQLTVHLQPIVEPAGQRVIAYEALARTGESRIPHPGVLFDTAERLDRIFEVSRRIRAIAADTMRDREELLFVNLHPRDMLDDDLYDATAPLSAIASRVVLEITERASLGGIDSLRGRVGRLRELGFRVAIDDLGAGYSGLSSFCALQAEVAKIDMSLVRDVDSTPTKQRLVRSLVEACRDLRIMFIAEGIETEQELITLQQLGCDRFQGYLFARPAPPFPSVRWPTAPA